MKTLLRISTALGLGLCLFVPATPLQAAMELPQAVEIARGGGRASGARTGFSSFSGGGGRGASRSSLNLDRGAQRQGNRTSRTDIRQTNRTDRVSDRNTTRRKTINTWDRNRPNWVNNNWANNRPWRYGWYGGNTWNSWGWWPGRAAAWGLGSLATFAVIDSLVDSAVNNQTSYIAVPDSDYALYYSSVQASGDMVSFQADDSSTSLTYRADCRAGTLNGMQPQSADAAQLLNAACQVAFGQ